MATEEHKRLSDVVKGTHALLRAECQRYGAEVAWKRHVSRKDLLQRYATSMRELATKCWTENNPRSYCRIEWMKARCEEYFLNGGRERYDERERDISAKVASSDTFRNFDSRTEDNYERGISLLDVGSCYDPFAKEDIFDVTAIDLAPATDAVLRCDFLHVAIGKEEILSRDKREIHQLAANSFDAVAFSLLLEYLPCPRQRYICCRNSYDVLKSGGVLIIASPDSKHVGANAKLIKSWRYTLSKLGFMRIKYEKLRHLHCLVFRKCVLKDVAIRWADLQRFSKDDEKYLSDGEIFIPQDFQETFPEEEQTSTYDGKNLTSDFSELPFANETI